MFKSGVFQFYVFSIFVVGTYGANILGIFPTAAKSHHIVGSALMQGLAKAGHSVTVISAFPLKEPLKNHRDIELTGLIEKNAIQEPDLFKFKDAPALMVLYSIYNYLGLDFCEYTLKHPSVVKLINSGEKFDLVVAEVFATESLYGFGQHFNAPVVALASFGASKWTNDLVGNPSPLSYIPHTFLSYTDKMTFKERFHNAALAIIENIYYDQIYMPKQKKLYDEAFPNARLSFEQAQKNFSLALLNHHFSLAFPRPYQPNMIEVGGMHVNNPKPLPDSLENYISSSKHGVIYFSMGSMLQGKNFPEEKRNAFIKAFAQLKENVLWKYENETIPNKPENVRILKWMPQNDILAHPNVKLFITHGGLLGSTEALFHGKPMVGIPIYGDQFLNIAKAEKAEYGVKLDYEDISEQTVIAAIEKVLKNPNYLTNSKLISERYRDKPLSPLQTAVYWVEYVIRHRGAPHLISSSTNLSFIQYNMIDVFVVMLFIAGIIISMQIFIIKKIIGLILKPTSKPTTKSNNKKKRN